ncbi:MAG: Cytochrome c556 [Rhodobacteraceae bacterium HLUCCA12]|nr:MAG: Cytochrome c556 [Rhodobacteraceae bacterium HLUCCA12]
MFHRLTALVLAAGLALPHAALADEAAEAAIGARKAQFQLFAFNLGVLGRMAQGRMPYDAEAAQTAADHLYHLTRQFNPALWPEGSDNASMEDTDALPVIWDDLEEFAGRYEDLQAQAETMQEAAGTDLAALQGAIGGLGGACSACHDDFRAE